jgi:hypothetical protein
MKHLLLISVLAIGLNMGTAHAQRQIPRAQSNNADVSTLEGVTLKNGQSSMLILANATIQKTSSNANGVTANAVTATAPTLLQKVGPYEIHRNSTAASTGAASAKPAQNLTVNGKSVPAFAEMGTGQDFVGAAYLNDTQSIGLISKQISAKFKTPSVPTQYAGMEAKELVPRSGLYIFTVTDIYAWIKLVSRMQADPQVSLVEPTIVTEFAQPQ